MLRFITGPTGAGKTAYMSGRILDALANTDRFVVTNLALEWNPWIDGKGKARHGLKWLIEQQYPHVDPEAWRERIYEFPPLARDKSAWDAIRWFFLYRPVLQEDGTRKLTKCENLLIKLGNGDDKVLFQCDEKMPRCHYSIDEGHEFFGAEDWATLAKGHRSWASQNRRAGDECDLGTQVPGNIAKPFRKLATECHVLINHAKLNWLFIKQPDKISYRVYPTTEWNPTDPVLRAGIMLRARQLIEGYNSAKGAGVQGAAADLGEKAKGLHWAYVPIILLVGCLALGWGVTKFWLWAVHRLQSKGIAAITAKHAATNAAPSSAPITAANPTTTPTQPGQQSHDLRTHLPLPPPIYHKEIPTIQGWCKGTQGYAITWEDGSISLARSLREEGRTILIDGLPTRLRTRQQNKPNENHTQTSDTRRSGPIAAVRNLRNSPTVNGQRLQHGD